MRQSRAWGSQLLDENTFCFVWLNYSSVCFQEICYLNKTFKFCVSILACHSLCLYSNIYLKTAVLNLTSHVLCLTTALTDDNNEKYSDFK